MKLVQSSLAVAAMIISSPSVYGQWNPDNAACEGCLEEADTFQSCVKEFCIDDKLYCLAAPPYVSSAALASCCGFDSDCEASAPKIDVCTEQCIPSCVEKSISEYLSCSERSNLSGACVMEDCITRIALDRDWIDVGENSDGSNFFDKLGDDLNDQPFSTDCDSTDAKGKKVCAIGADCCSGCNPELGVVMHCIVNEMIRPWLKSDSFDSDDDECSALSAGTNSNPGKKACETLLDSRRERQLTDMEETTDETDGVVSDTAMKATQECMKGMKWNVALGNATEAGSATINCVVVEGARMLQPDDEEEPKASNAAASPKSVLSAAFLVVAAASVFA